MPKNELKKDLTRTYDELKEYEGAPLLERAARNSMSSTGFHRMNNEEETDVTTTRKKGRQKRSSNKKASRKNTITVERLPNEDSLHAAARPLEGDLPVQPGQMGQESDQTTELNLSPSDIRESGFGQFIDDEWGMDENFKESFIHPRDTNVKKSDSPENERVKGKSEDHPS
jgi:hypothetical protein